MRVTVHVKPGSRKANSVRRDDGSYDIAVIERPERGRATDAARRALADALGVAPSRLSLVMGAASRTKVFDLT
jgi:uncharacterized protein YggU (UPF0235/DUF167 family)